MLPLAVVLFTLKSYDGREAGGELLTLKVPERRDVRGSRTIEVASPCSPFRFPPRRRSSASF